MQYYFVMCRSLTYAQRAARVLERAGITGIVTKAPQGASDKGCAYSVKVSETRLKEALEVLRRAGLGTGHVFLQTGGRLQEVWP